MPYKLGKIIDFDGYVGKIQSDEEQYFFIDSSINGEIKNGDLVVFTPEIINGEYRAFFVEKYIINSERSI